MSVVGILPAAGSGRRFGAAKQFRELRGLPLLVHAALGFERAPSIQSFVVAVPAGDEERVRALLLASGLQKLHRVVAGGAERAESVRRALEAAPPGARYAVIHDAARPFASPALFERVIEAAREQGAAIAAVRCTDTIKEGEGSRIARTLDRSRLWMAQTPQAFRIDWLEAAHAELGEDAGRFTDEAALLEAAGREVHLVEGERENFKVTEPEDWERAEAKVVAETELFGPSRGGPDARREEGAYAAVCDRRATPQPGPAAGPIAVGQGIDVHAFQEGRPLILGGLEFPGEVGLAGHSDADVVLHALMDALLGAAGLGDIGEHFPDTKEAFRGADSARLLEVVLEKVGAAGYAVGNADLTVLAQRPRLGPRREEMRGNIARLLGLPPGRVNVKASTTERLGFVGRSEGIACQAVVLLHRNR